MGKNLRMKLLAVMGTLIIGALSFSTLAQEENSAGKSVNDEFNDVLQDDANYDKALSETAIPKSKAPEKKQVEKAPEVTGLAGLGSLSDFNDVAVINRKFLPKTKRFEFFPNVGFIVNDAFFLDLVYGGRLAFYFSENYGVEVTANLMSNSNKLVTTELIDRFVSTDSLLFPTAYYGLDFKWSPLYGKIGWMNRTIVPFDFYFSAGGGITQTNQRTSPPTIHLGLGQSFALSKWLAFRWDVSWYGYQSISGVAGGVSGTYSNIYANLGVSIFFPGAEYR